jgi:hypothetical protein
MKTERKIRNFLYAFHKYSWLLFRPELTGPILKLLPAEFDSIESILRLWCKYTTQEKLRNPFLRILKNAETVHLRPIAPQKLIAITYKNLC